MAFLLRRRKIAVVEIFGTIGGGVRTQPYERIFSNIRMDRRVRALVLDVDSPGGGAPASDSLYRSVAKVAEAKPVVASIRGVGTSGAYLVSCGAHKIVASQGSMVGSIGVMSVRPVLQTLFQRLGISVNVSKSGEFKDMGAFWRDATPGEKQKMQELIDQFYEVFISIVAKARRLDQEKTKALATGEVFWAPRAKELGLVDELGDLDRAIDLAAELSGAPRRPVYIRPRRGLRHLLFGSLAEALVESVEAQIERRLWLESLKY